MLLNLKNNVTEDNLIYRHTRFNTKTIKFRHKYKCGISHRAVEERPISPRGQRTSYFGTFTASTWPVRGPSYGLANQQCFLVHY